MTEMRDTAHGSEGGGHLKKQDRNKNHSIFGRVSAVSHTRIKIGLLGAKPGCGPTNTVNS